MNENNTNQEDRKSPFKRGLVVAILLVTVGLLIWAFSGSKKTSDEVSTFIRPTFDTVRVEKGKGIIVGRADADIKVHIVSGDKEIGAEHTDSRGEFVFLPEKKFTAGTYEMYLFVMDKEQKIMSPHKAILTIDKKSNESVAVLIGNNKAKLIDAPKKEKGAGKVGITLVEYDLKKKFNMSGYGIKDHSVNMYLNDKLLGKTDVDNAGWWSFEMEKKLVKDKSYRIRVDLIDQAGKIVARTENQFSTEIYEGTKSLYVVKKGDCLWRIAKRKLGRGIDYVLIFKANKSQIRNPDLIYPKQKFKIPQK